MTTRRVVFGLDARHAGPVAARGTPKSATPPWAASGDIPPGEPSKGSPTTAHTTGNDELPTRELPLLHPNVRFTGASGSFVHNDKDKVETYLFHAQCAGKARLSAIQKAVSQNWTTAIAVLGLPPIPAGYRG